MTNGSPLLLSAMEAEVESRPVVASNSLRNTRNWALLTNAGMADANATAIVTPNSTHITRADWLRRRRRASSINPGIRRISLSQLLGRQPTIPLNAPQTQQTHLIRALVRLQSVSANFTLHDRDFSQRAYLRTTNTSQLFSDESS